MTKREARRRKRRETTRSWETTRKEAARDSKVRRDKKAVSWRQSTRDSVVERVCKATRIIDTEKAEQTFGGLAKSRRESRLIAYMKKLYSIEETVVLYVMLSQHEFYTGYNVKACE